MVIWFTPYVVASIVHVVLLGVAVDGPAVPVTKGALMPLLAIAVITTVLHRTRPGSRSVPRTEAEPTTRWPTWLAPALVALTFSWFGDVALDGSRGTRFLIGIGFFLIAQLAYIVTFRRVNDPSSTSSRPWLVGPYVAWYVGFLAYFLVANGPEPLLAAVAVYGVALGAMAFLAHRVNVVTAVGAASFLISDSLIGLNGFAGLELPLYGVWVMSTYLLGQALIVTGLLRLEATGQVDHHRPVPARGNRTPSA